MSYPGYPSSGRGSQRPESTQPVIPNQSQTQLAGSTSRPSTLGGRNVQLLEALSSFSPTICTKSSDELFSLLTIESEFEEFFDSIPDVINQKINLRDFQLGNEELAKDNLTYRPHLAQLKNEVEAKCQSIKLLEEDFQNLKRKESSYLEKLSPNRLISKLKEERAIIDSESSELTSLFLRKELPVEDYIAQFRTKRTQFYQYELRIHDIDKRPLPVYDSVGNPVKSFGN